MKKRTFIFCLVMSLCLCAEAQNTGKLITVSLKAGLIFIARAPDVTNSISNEMYNKWNVDFSIEENKFGFGLTARYISGNVTRTAISNPFYRPLIFFNRQTIKLGDIVNQQQNYSNWSFLLSKRLFFIKNKHRLDVSIGTQLRQGSTEYFLEFSPFNPWEIVTTGDYMDKYGLLSRLGYTYMIAKHISLTTNIEYAKFKKAPSDFFDFNVLIGVRF